MSSTRGDPGALADLDRRMTAFYARPDLRAGYQAMLDTQEDAPLRGGSVGYQLAADIVAAGPARVVEVGCGNGWVYRQLRRAGFAGQYTGLEMADWLVERNRRRHPEATWVAGSGYAVPVADGAAEACFAFYVLEHAVYPERMLAELLRVTAPEGTVCLAFPDFCAAGYVPSQLTGRTPGSARDKRAAGRYADAALTLLDSRLRVRPAIRRAADRFGPFPVNTRPVCLDHPGRMWPDIDAVYLADKHEVAGWLRGRGCEVTFPLGTAGEFALHTYLRAGVPLGGRA